MPNSKNPAAGSSIENTVTGIAAKTKAYNVANPVDQVAGAPAADQSSLLGNIPQELKDKARWLCWKSVLKKGKTKPDKVPLNIETGKPANPLLPEQWFTFDEAVAALGKHHNWGLGFVFSADDDIVGIDVDGIIENQKVVADMAVQNILKTAHDQNCYIEKSPSGNGVHIIVRGEFAGGVNTPSVEIYNEKRFFTFTGRGKGELLLAQDVIDRASFVAGVRKKNEDSFAGAQTGVGPIKGAEIDNDDLGKQTPYEHDQLNLLSAIKHFPDHISDEEGTWGVKEEEPFKKFMRAGTAAYLAAPEEDCQAIKEAVLARCALVSGYEGVDNEEHWARFIGENKAGKSNTPPEHIYKGARKNGWEGTVVTSELEIGAWGAGQPKLADLMTLPLHPPVIVEDYHYADLGVTTGPGGSSKTTTTLYEAIHICLGNNLWGKNVPEPKMVLFVSAEDPMWLIYARMGRLMEGLRLSQPDRQTVLVNFNVLDVSGTDMRLVQAAGGTFVVHPTVQNFIDVYNEAADVGLIIFDPIVSFGANEEAVNSNAQALVKAARKIIAEMGCGVRFLSHTGQSAAAANMENQYNTRGGTALPDGCRMVTNFLPLERGTAPPIDPDVFATWQIEERSIFKIAQPKMSYAAKPASFWVGRKAWEFEWAYEVAPPSEGQVNRNNMVKVLELINDLIGKGFYPTKTSLRELHRDEIKLTKPAIEKAIEGLHASDQITDEPLPPEKVRGQKKTYVKPI